MTATAFVPLLPPAPGNAAPVGSSSHSPIGSKTYRTQTSPPETGLPGSDEASVKDGSVSVLGGFEAVLARLQSADTDAAAGKANGEAAPLGGNVVSIAPLRGIEDVPPQILFPGNGITLEVLDGKAVDATPLTQTAGAAVGTSETGEQPLFAVDERGQLLVSAQLLAAVLARLDGDGQAAKQALSKPSDEGQVPGLASASTGESTAIPIAVPPETLTEIPIVVSGDVPTAIPATASIGESVAIPITIPPDAQTEIPIVVSGDAPTAIPATASTGKSVAIPVTVSSETLTEIPITVSGDVSVGIPSTIPITITTPTEQPVEIPITVSGDVSVGIPSTIPITITTPTEQPVEIPITVSGDVSDAISSTVPVTILTNQPVEIPVAVSPETTAHVSSENASALGEGEYVAVALPGALLAATSENTSADGKKPMTASAEQSAAQKPTRAPAMALPAEPSARMSGQPATGDKPNALETEIRQNPTVRDGSAAAVRQLTAESDATESRVPDKTSATATRREAASTDTTPALPKASSGSAASAAAATTQAVEGKARNEVYLRVPTDALPESLQKQDAKLVLHVSRTPNASANAATANPTPANPTASATNSGTQVTVNGQTVSVEVLAEGSETSSGRGQSQNQDRPRQDAQAQDLKAYLQGEVTKAESGKGPSVELSQAERDFVKETHRDKTGLPPHAADKTATERSAAELPAAKPETEGQTARQAVDTSRSMTNGAERAATTTSTASSASTAGGTTMKETIARYEQISQQIVRGVSAQIGESRSHVTIRLSPEHLGQVDVRLVLDEGVLSARLWASEPETRTLLERHASQLRATLEESGVRVDRVTVSRETAERGGYQREQANQERQADQERERRHAQREGDGNPNGSKRRQDPNPAPFSFSDMTADETPA